MNKAVFTSTDWQEIEQQGRKTATCDAVTSVQQKKEKQQELSHTGCGGRTIKTGMAVHIKSANQKLKSLQGEQNNSLMITVSLVRSTSTLDLHLLL